MKAAHRKTIAAYDRMINLADTDISLSQYKMKLDSFTDNTWGCNYCAACTGCGDCVLYVDMLTDDCNHGPLRNSYKDLRRESLLVSKKVIKKLLINRRDDLLTQASWNLYGKEGADES